jgi:hypothetical protein
MPADIEARGRQGWTSSRWYQRLLGCRSARGGADYERLLLLWFEVDDFDAALARAADMKAARRAQCCRFDA